MIRAVPQYLSAQELADLELAGLPTTKRRVNATAKRQNWKSVMRTGKGGGLLYSILSLPAEARRDLMARRAMNENIRDRGRPAGVNFFTENPDIADAVEAILATRKLSAPRVRELLKPQFAVLPTRAALSKSW